MYTRISQVAVPVVLAVASLILAGCGSGSAPQQSAAPSATDQVAPVAPAGQAEQTPTPNPNAGPAESVKKPPEQKANTRQSPQSGVAGSQAVEVSGDITVRTTSTLSTKTNQVGQTFEASLAQPLLAGGKQVLPKGAPVLGKVTDVDPGGRVRGRATISVELTGLQAGGRVIAIATDTFVQEAPATKKKDAAKVGIGAGIGAAIGAIAGGAKGAAIGAGAGGGAGTAAVLVTRGDPAEIPSETVLTFKLAKPVRIPAR